MAYLVDTNVVSELLKAEPNACVVEWMDGHAVSSFISSVTIEEMRFGALFMPEGRRKRRLAADIDALLETYRPFIWAFDAEAAEQCARYHALAVKAGRTPAIEDLMIAAIATCHEAPVVTRNVRDFEYLGVPVIDPFGKG